MNGKINFWLVVMLVLSILVLVFVLVVKRGFFEAPKIEFPISNKSRPQNQNKILTNQEVLKQMFPGKNLIQVKNRRDCFYNSQLYEQAEPGKIIADVYCLGKPEQGSFFDSTTNGPTALAIVYFGVSQLEKKTQAVEFYGSEYPSNPHVLGIIHTFFGLFDKTQGKLISEVYENINDFTEIKLFECNNKKYITITGHRLNQGYGEVNSSMLKISKDGKFIKNMIISEQTSPSNEISMTASDNGIMVYKHNQQTNKQELQYGMVWNKEKCIFEKQ